MWKHGSRCVSQRGLNFNDRFPESIDGKWIVWRKRQIHKSAKGTDHECDRKLSPFAFILPSHKKLISTLCDSPQLKPSIVEPGAPGAGSQGVYNAQHPSWWRRGDTRLGNVFLERYVFLQFINNNKETLNLPNVVRRRDQGAVGAVGAVFEIPGVVKYLQPKFPQLSSWDFNKPVSINSNILNAAEGEQEW